MRIEENVIKNVIGTAIPKPVNDQNTDDIVPARFLKEITFVNMGEYAFFDERYKGGKEVPEHPFNKYKGGSILLAGSNFGCGSSREHAPQALQRYGIKAIIAPSYAEIFAGNCASLGVVGVTVDSDDLEGLVDIVIKDPSTKIEIDLDEKIITYGRDTILPNTKAAIKVGFDISEGKRQAFLNGTWDAMTVLQQNEEGIQKVEKNLKYLTFK